MHVVLCENFDKTTIKPNQFREMSNQTKPFNKKFKPNYLSQTN